MNEVKMLKRFVFICFTLLVVAVGVASASSTQHETHSPAYEQITPFAFSIMGGSNSILNPYSDRNVNFHLSLFSGQVRGVQGLQIGAISNRVTSDFVGYDATGIYSRVDGNFSGFMAGGLVGRVDGNFIGMQNAGIYNHVGADFFGLQTSGIVNQVDGEFTGLQVSGIHNESKNVRFAQIAGISNEASDVEGVQIAGIVNNAKHVRGVQIGLVNRSEKLDGIAIGLVNLSESGSVHLVSWGSSVEDYQMGIKFAPNNYWYTILTMGQELTIAGQDLMTSFQAHMGFHLPLVAKFYTEIDLGSGNTIPSKFVSWESEDSQNTVEGRISVGLKITPRLSIFGGVSHSRDVNDSDFFDSSVGKTAPFFGIQI